MHSPCSCAQGKPRGAEGGLTRHGWPGPGETPRTAWAPRLTPVSAEGLAEGPKEAEKRGSDGDDGRGADGPQVPAEPGPQSSMEEVKQAPREEAATATYPPPSLPGRKRPGLPAKGGARAPSPDPADREKGVRAEGGQQKEHQEGEEEAGEKAGSEDEGPTATADPHPTSGYKDGR